MTEIDTEMIFYMWPWKPDKGVFHCVQQHQHQQVHHRSFKSSKLWNWASSRPVYLGHTPQLLGWLTIWRIWRPSQHLQLFIMPIEDTAIRKNTCNEAVCYFYLSKLHKKDIRLSTFSSTASTGWASSNSASWCNVFTGRLNEAQTSTHPHLLNNAYVHPVVCRGVRRLAWTKAAVFWHPSMIASIKVR